MKTLLYEELKKIFKRKSSILLCVGLCIFSFYTIFSSYQKYPYHSIIDSHITYQSLEGKSLDHIELARYIDSLLHKYQGTYNRELYETMKQDYLQLLQQYSTNEIDENKMQDVYGEGYKDIFQKIRNHEMTEEQISQYQVEQRIPTYYNNDNPKEFPFVTIYKNDAIIHTIELAYLSVYMELDFYPPSERFDEANKRYESYLIHHRFYDGEEMEGSSGQYQYCDQKLSQMSHHYDSTISINLIVQAIEKSLIPTLFIVFILLSNIFGMEKQYQTDQIIYPTLMTRYKIVQSKLIAGIVIGLGLTFIQVMICFAVGIILVPIHDLNVIVSPMAQSALYYPQYPLTYIELLMTYIFLIITAFLIITIVTMFISYITLNRFITVIAMFVMMLVNIIITYMMYIPSWIQGLSPFIMTQITRIIDYNNTNGVTNALINIDGHYILLTYLTAMGWLVAIIIMVLFMLKKSKCSYIK